MILDFNSEKKINRFKIAAFYLFSPLQEDSISSILTQVDLIAQEHEIKGSILVAPEGINGTICGVDKGVDFLLGALNSIFITPSLEIKYSWSIKQSFRRFKARRKAEIVTMGVSEIKPVEGVGIYVEPESWNEFIDDPDTLIIDTRNNYEIAIGSFEGSINPHTETFREFPFWVDEILRPMIDKKPPKRIAMFCTGGIRCEKATSYLMKQGLCSVYHLHGGILSYLEQVPKNKSRWNGECFVFDQRVSLDHTLSEGSHLLCHACGRPLSPDDRKNSKYIPGVQCKFCINSFTDSDRARFAERQNQIDQQRIKELTKVDTEVEK